MTERELAALEIAHEFVTAVEQWKKLELTDLDGCIKAKLLVLKISRRNEILEGKIKQLCSVLDIGQMTVFVVGTDNGRNLLPPLW